MISLGISSFIGAVFLLSALAKIFHSGPFIQRVYEYYPTKWTWMVGVVFIGFELALGLAYILQMHQPLLFPFGMALLLMFSAITLWGYYRKNVEDCGCYGGLLKITPLQSTGLNIIYLILLGVAWFSLEGPTSSEPWQWILVLLAGAAGSFGSLFSLREPLKDLSPVRPGKRWKTGWLENSPFDISQGEVLVAFLGPECPYCKRWVPILNILHSQTDLPDIVGVMGISSTKVDAFCQQHHFRIPVTPMNSIRFDMLAPAVPMILHLVDGVIVEKLEGELPRQFEARVEHVYDIFPDPAPESTVFSG